MYTTLRLTWNLKYSRLTMSTALLSQGWVPVTDPVNTESGPIESGKSCGTYGG